MIKIEESEEYQNSTIISKTGKVVGQVSFNVEMGKCQNRHQKEERE